MGTRRPERRWEIGPVVEFPGLAFLKQEISLVLFGFPNARKNKRHSIGHSWQKSGRKVHIDTSSSFLGDLGKFLAQMLLFWVFDWKRKRKDNERGYLEGDKLSFFFPSDRHGAFFFFFFTF